MQIGKVTYADLSHVKKLQPEGWADISGNFIRYLNYDFCYPVKATIDKQIVGLGCSILFKNSAWIAHIIVDPNYRNRGIGAEIVNYLIELIKQMDIYSISLIATAMGEPVYKKTGFEVISDYVYLNRKSSWVINKVAESIVPYSSGYYQQLIDLDFLISGENREKLIKKYIDNALLYVDKNSVKGYYLPFLGEGAIYARNSTAGTELMKVKYSVIDKAVLPLENRTAIDFLKQNGFEEGGTNGKRMILGEKLNWNPECMFSRIGGNYG